MNAERILIAAECIRDGRWFVDHASSQAKRASFWASHRAESGGGIPDRMGACAGRGADLMRQRAATAYQDEELRGRSKHGKAVGRTVVAGGEYVPRHVRRRRVRSRI